MSSPAVDIGESRRLSRFRNLGKKLDLDLIDFKFVKVVWIPALVKKKKWILLGTLVSFFAGYGIRSVGTTKYEYSTTLRVGQVNGIQIEKPIDIIYSLTSTSNLRDILASPPLFYKDDSSNLNLKVRTVFKQDNYFAFTVVASSARVCSAVAKALAQQLIDAHTALYQANVSIIRDQAANLENDLKHLRTQREQGIRRWSLTSLDLMESSARANLKLQPYAVSEELIQQMEQKVVDLKLSLLNQVSRQTSIIDVDFEPRRIGSTAIIFAMRVALGAFFLLVVLTFLLVPFEVYSSILKSEKP